MQALLEAVAPAAAAACGFRCQCSAPASAEEKSPFPSNSVGGPGAQLDASSRCRKGKPHFVAAIQHHHRGIVMYVVASATKRSRRAETGDQGSWAGRPDRAGGLQALDQPVFIEALPARPAGFTDPIGVIEDDISRVRAPNVLASHSPLRAAGRSAGRGHRGRSTR